MTRDQENINYLHYLEQRSKLAFFYRMKVLYPKINRFLGVKPLDIGCGIGDMLTYRNDVVELFAGSLILLLACFQCMCLA